MVFNSQQDKHFLAGKRIVVSGAGIAGLAFVRALQQTWPDDIPRPSISVYERDPRHLAPERGNYSLGLRSDKASLGLQAVQRLGLINEVYAARQQSTDGNMMLRDAEWSILFKVKPSDTPPDGLPCDRMRITRHDIRECLIAGTDQSTNFHWETACTSAATLKDGSVEIALDDGSMTTCDLLIIADGASSKLRAHLRPSDGLQYAGAVMIGGQATFPEDAVPLQLQKGCGPLLGGDGHGMIFWPTTGSSYVWFITRRSPHALTVLRGQDDVKNQEQILNEARNHGKVFGEPLSQLLDATDPNSLKTMNAQDKPPVAHADVLAHPYVFIGDANHAVSPFAGNGANMSLVDGVALADSLCNSSTLSMAMQKFDEDSIPRCKATVKKSHILIAVAHSKGLLFRLVVLFLRILSFFMR